MSRAHTAKLGDQSWGRCQTHRFRHGGGMELHQSEVATRAGHRSIHCPRGKYSPVSDIFAVGVIAYKMLTGSFPYNGRLFDDKPGENWVGSPKMKEIKQKLCDARVSWSHPVFEKEPGASRLVSRMLAVDESERPDAPECLRDPWLSELAKPSQDSQPMARAVLVHQVRGRAQPVQSQQRGMAHSAAIGNVQNLLAGRSVESSQGRRKRSPPEMPGNWTLH